MLGDAGIDDIQDAIGQEDTAHQQQGQCDDDVKTVSEIEQLHSLVNLYPTP